MNPIVVSDILAVGEVPSVEQIAILAKAGFKAILNNQRDGEVESLPGSAALSGEAATHGLVYAYAPLESRTPTPEELLVFARALDRLPAPIYAFCYSGARSAAATAFLLTREKNPTEIIAEFAAAGYPVDSLKPWLDELREVHAPGAIAAEAAALARSTTLSSANATSTVAPVAAPAARTPASPMPTAPVGIIVHARPRGASGFAMVSTNTR